MFTIDLCRGDEFPFSHGHDLPNEPASLGNKDGLRRSRDARSLTPLTSLCTRVLRTMMGMHLKNLHKAAQVQSRSVQPWEVKIRRIQTNGHYSTFLLRYRHVILGGEHFLFMPTITRFWMSASGSYFPVHAQLERVVPSRKSP
jgi:hypothetical protein